MGDGFAGHTPGLASPYGRGAPNGGRRGYSKTVFLNTEFGIRQTLVANRHAHGEKRKRNRYELLLPWLSAYGYDRGRRCPALYL